MIGKGQYNNPSTPKDECFRKLCCVTASKPPYIESGPSMLKSVLRATASRSLYTPLAHYKIYKLHSLDLLLKNINQLAYKSASLNLDLRNACGNGTITNYSVPAKIVFDFYTPCQNEEVLKNFHFPAKLNKKRSIFLDLVPIIH
jgi:hypothetical protein